MKTVKQSIELLWITPKPLQAIELAGRTCYKSENRITPQSAANFVSGLNRSGHHAMIEHAVASFRIITDRGVSHEIVRHRLASYAQESTRYCNYGSNKFQRECTFIKPIGLAHNNYDAWEAACINAEDVYFNLLRDNLAQVARSVLPNCLKTELIMTANFREWMHFIKLRSASDAHPQIRPIARMISSELHNYAPELFKLMEN